MKTVLTLFSAFALLLASEVSAGDCPGNVVFYGSEGVSEYSNLSAYGYFEGPAWSEGQPCAGACYDLRQGYLYGAGWRGPWNSPETSMLRVSDIFQVEGLPLGTVVSFQAELHIVTTSPHPARIMASIRETEGGGQQSIDELTSESTETRILSIPIQTSVGDPFTLECEMIIGPPAAEGESKAIGRIRFRDLRPGGFIASCQSYDVPVPSNGVTWGAIKVRYR